MRVTWARVSASSGLEGGGELHGQGSWADRTLGQPERHKVPWHLESACDNRHEGSAHRRTRRSGAPAQGRPPPDLLYVPWGPALTAATRTSVSSPDPLGDPDAHVKGLGWASGRCLGQEDGALTMGSASLSGHPGAPSAGCHTPQRTLRRQRAHQGAALTLAAQPGAVSSAPVDKPGWCCSVRAPHRADGHNLLPTAQGASSESPCCGITLGSLAEGRVTHLTMPVFPPPVGPTVWLGRHVS